MTESDVFLLQLYLLFVPKLIFAIGVITVLLSLWLDTREDRRKARQSAPTHS